MGRDAGLRLDKVGHPSQHPMQRRSVLLVDSQAIVALERLILVQQPRVQRLCQRLRLKPVGVRYKLFIASPMADIVGSESWSVRRILGCPLPFAQC